MSAETRTYTLEKEVSRLSDFAALVKVRLSALVVFTAVLAYVIAAGAAMNWMVLMYLTVGGMATTAAANAMNQVFEQDFDKLMARTENRPLPSGRMKTTEAVFIAGIMCLVGITSLAAINPVAATIGMSSLILYAFLYTPMKRFSPVSVWIGGIPGAFPVLIGCAAAQGEITWLALSLFAIQYLWQLPHFWAIGYLGFEDYQKAGYNLLPTKNGKIHDQLGMHSFLACVAMLVVLVAMNVYGNLNYIELALSVILTVVYAACAWNFHRKMERATALRLMFTSFFYLPLVLITFWLV